MPFHSPDPDRAAIYGTRARIGYPCPPLLAEVFAVTEMGCELMRRHPNADGIFFPSPHWPVIQSIDSLEREFDVPVMAASQACIWDVLRLTGIADRISGYGRLLREF